MEILVVKETVLLYYVICNVAVFLVGMYYVADSLLEQ